MTPEAQRIAIAEFCGWKRVVFQTQILAIKSTEWTSPNGTKYPDIGYLPDYLNDLNAMHEAELSSFKTPTERCNYLCCLENVSSRTREVCSDHTIDPVTQWACFSTAAQRAEALLRTIGKWKDRA